MAAKEMSLATVPCIVLGHLTPALLGKAIGNHLVRSWGPCADDLEGAWEKSGFRRQAERVCRRA
jgi:hypothetical protein